jgi:hypothetical protein
MDNFESGNSGKKEDLDAPIPFDDDDTSEASVSHSPSDLGGSTAEVPTAEVTAQPMAKKIVSSERITGVKTFFTKLHPGAIDFLDEQITNWLSDNPGITIKRTNTVTGPVQGKTTEPNIIITIWY